MDFITDEFVCSAQEFRREKDDGCGTIPDFLVLLRGEGNEDTCRWVRHLEEGENGRSVIGNGHIADVVHEHLVETGVSGF